MTADLRLGRFDAVGNPGTTIELTLTFVDDAGAAVSVASGVTLYTGGTVTDVTDLTGATGTAATISGAGNNIATIDLPVPTTRTPLRLTINSVVVSVGTISPTSLGGTPTSSVTLTLAASTATVTVIGSVATGGAGAVATDAIWDAKGDLAVGTGANTASKLTAGTNGYVLTTDSAQATGLKWAAAGGTGTVTEVTGTAPIAVATGTTTPVVSIAAASTSVPGSMSAADKTKLDGIESAATADQTAAEILAKLITVDGTGTSLDADTVDGSHASAFQPVATVLTNTTASFTTAQESKLSGIEASADVTDATNVSAAGAAMISSGAGAPASTPAKVGNIYIDTTGDRVYVATDVATSADWDLLPVTAAQVLALLVTVDGTGSGLDADTLDGSHASAFQPLATVLTNTTAAFTTAQETKLSGIETAADVTDATNVASAGAVMATTIAAKGDLLVGTANDALTVLTAGTNDYVLTADSAQATGLKWAAASGGGAPTTSQYVTLATDGTLSNERVLTAGTAAKLTDAGAGSTVTLGLNAGAAANALTGSPTLAMWLDANQIGQSDGTNVVTWTDATGNGHSPTNATAGEQPVVHNSVAALGGMPAVKFDGTNDFLTIASRSIGTFAACTVAVVCHKLATTDNNQLLRVNNGSTPIDVAYEGGYEYRANGAVSYTNGDTGINRGTHLLLGVFDGSTQTLFIDGNAVGVTFPSGSVSGTYTVLVGGLSNSSYNFPGYIAEIAMYNGALTAAQRLELTRGLANKYSLPIVIPA